MAKTTYRTWTPGELATAAMLNEQLRDNGNEIWKGTTNGDLDYYTGATTKARRAIGAAGQVLQVVSGVPAWASYSGAVIETGPQAIANNTDTIITGWSETVDTDSYHTAGQNTLVPSATGLYAISAEGYFDAHVTAGTLREIAIVLTGGVNIARVSLANVANQNMYMTVSAVYYVGAAQTLTLYALQKSGGNLDFRSIKFSIARIK